MYLGMEPWYGWGLSIRPVQMLLHHQLVQFDSQSWCIGYLDVSLVHNRFHRRDDQVLPTGKVDRMHFKCYKPFSSCNTMHICHGDDRWACLTAPTLLLFISFPLHAAPDANRSRSLILRHRRYELPITWSPLVSRPSLARLLKTVRSSARLAALFADSQRNQKISKRSFL